MVAESKNDSFATKFALNELIYVLYANVSSTTEKLEPSKSKSVKFEFERRKSFICALISAKSKLVNCVKGIYLVGSKMKENDCVGKSRPLISKNTVTLNVLSSGKALTVAPT